MSSLEQEVGVIAAGVVVVVAVVVVTAVGAAGGFPIGRRNIGAES